MTLTEEKTYSIGGVGALELVRKYGTPLYVYDEGIMRAQYSRLWNAFSGVEHKRINFAMKALSNVNVLKIMRGYGSGIDAVSVNEARLALSAGFSPSDIVFTPNGVCEAELDEAVALGIHVNIDSLETLSFFGDRYPGVPVGVRINPHIYAGGNDKIAVGSRDSKFGISVEYAGRLEELVRGKNININGVHMHTGSDIYDVDIFLQGAELLFSVASRFPSVEYVDFGSGFKVPYKEGDKQTDIELLGARLSERFNAFSAQAPRKVRLMIEPGKFLVSRSGTLLVNVNWVKQTPAAMFAQVDSGLNHLIRPMMYDAYHHIINVSNPGGQARMYNVTGYICETDNFARGREISEIRRGDTLAILNAGAYGYMMSSNYNSRFRPAEVMVKDGRDYLISRREELADLLATQVDAGF